MSKEEKDYKIKTYSINNDVLEMIEEMRHNHRKPFTQTKKNPLGTPFAATQYIQMLIKADYKQNKK